MDPNPPTTADYAANQSYSNRNALRALEERVDALERSLATTDALLLEARQTLREVQESLDYHLEAE